MKSLYARFIYWLIEPALKRHEEELSKKLMAPLSHIKAGVEFLQVVARQQNAAKEADDVIQNVREESKKS